MAKETFSAEESLLLIQTMINKTRQDFSDRSHYFLLWGWAALIACAAQYVLKVVVGYPRHYLVWWVTVVCLAVTIFFSWKDSKKLVVRTYVNENLSNVWIGLTITFFVMSMIFVRFGFQYCFPFFITLYGVGAFVSGRILQFPPLTWGGMVGWILAIAAGWVAFDIQILFAAAALLICFIIPGHLLRNRYARS